MPAPWRRAHTPKQWCHREVQGMLRWQRTHIIITLSQPGKYKVMENWSIVMRWCLWSTLEEFLEMIGTQCLDTLTEGLSGPPAALIYKCYVFPEPYNAALKPSNVCYSFNNSASVFHYWQLSFYSKSMLVSLHVWSQPQNSHNGIVNYKFHSNSCLTRYLL